MSPGRPVEPARPAGRARLPEGLSGGGLRKRSVAERVLVWLQRFVAVFCLLFGVSYWVRIIGLYDLPLWRFDLMPVPWQVASVTLAAFFPFAAIGLWMLASWGPVIWLICAGTELTMFLGFPQIFGTNRLVVVSHGMAIMLYAACRAVIAYGKRRERVSGN